MYKIAYMSDNSFRIEHSIKKAKEELSDIFGVFVVSSKTKTSAGGRGIGLALAKKVISEHNGKIWAKQNQGKGVTVAFSLPI